MRIPHYVLLSFFLLGARIANADGWYLESTVAAGASSEHGALLEARIAAGIAPRNSNVRGGVVATVVTNRGGYQAGAGGGLGAELEVDGRLQRWGSLGARVALSRGLPITGASDNFVELVVGGRWRRGVFVGGVDLGVFRAPLNQPSYGAAMFATIGLQSREHVVRTALLTAGVSATFVLAVVLASAITGAGPIGI
jgi:hypothetical protein